MLFLLFYNPTTTTNSIDMLLHKNVIVRIPDAWFKKPNFKKNGRWHVKENILELEVNKRKLQLKYILIL